MKKSIYLITVMAITTFSVVVFASAAEQHQSPQNELQIICSPELKSLGSDCATAYSGEHTGVTMKLKTSGEESLNEYLKYPGRIAVVTSNNLNQIDSKELRIFPIGREVFVPVMNPANPWIDKINKSGISPGEFAMAYNTNGGVPWSSLLGADENIQLNAYRISDPSFERDMSGFLGLSGGKLGGNVLGSCEQVMQAVSNDRYGMGFCKLSQLQGLENLQSDKVAVVPIDINENNRIDQFETYYRSVEDLARGVWIGKYPASLSNRLYVVYNQRLSGADEIAFVKWLVSDGQAYFNDHGFSTLLAREQSSILAGLESQPAAISDADQGVQKSSVLLLIFSFIFGGILLLFVVLKIFNVKENDEEKGIVRISRSAFRSEPMEAPGGYFFDKTHTWAFMEKSGDISIGIDGFIQHVAGKVTKVELRQPGEKVKKGETVFSLIQNGKTLNIKSPISGIIKEKNKNLTENAGLLNSSPYGEGWLYLMEPLNWQVEMKAFLMPDKYKEWTRSEFDRLKDFMMTVLQPLSSKHIVLQDGGEIRESLLEEFGPEAWEEFQTGFLKN